jgi:hypothetical protein
LEAVQDFPIFALGAPLLEHVPNTACHPARHVFFTYRAARLCSVPSLTDLRFYDLAKRGGFALKSAGEDAHRQLDSGNAFVGDPGFEPLGDLGDERVLVRILVEIEAVECLARCFAPEPNPALG